MKQFIIFFYSIIYLQTITFSQTTSNGIKSVGIYIIEWNIKSKIAFTTKNFKDRYHYYFECMEGEFDYMFLDYNDCIEKLSSQKQIPPDSTSCSMIRAYVVIRFNLKNKVELFFDPGGNYYFRNKWHTINYGLYYKLFKCFSDQIIHPKIMDIAKQNFIDELWHFE